MKQKPCENIIRSLNWIKGCIEISPESAKLMSHNLLKLKTPKVSDHYVPIKFDRIKQMAFLKDHPKIIDSKEYILRHKVKDVFEKSANLRPNLYVDHEPFNYFMQSSNMLDPHVITPIVSI